MTNASIIRDLAITATTSSDGGRRHAAMLDFQRVASAWDSRRGALSYRRADGRLVKDPVSAAQSWAR